MRAFEHLLVERPREGVVLATLNRPERMNALLFGTFDELRWLCEDIERDPAARVLVLTGAGRGFCSGLDLADAGRLREMSAAEMLARQEGWAAGIAAFRRLPKPVVAAVNGAAAGAGLALALAADVRVASTAARFNAAFVRIGLSGGDVGTSWLLPRIVGLGRAAEIMLTGRMVDAPYAERIGLVNVVAEPEALLDTAFELAAEMVSNSPFAMRLTKQVLQTNVDAPSLEAALELENRNQVLATRTEDMTEALAAFRDKRPAHFRGR
jgi:enoyl-CoA hydratase/carnithine racemase